ncbi:MAG: leucine-rich repeat domain-containing protein [Methanomicrobia archaeon]|nr:leucine-rich repeat domain-containing protein [Methanomicrobia archaeon]
MKKRALVLAILLVWICSTISQMKIIASQEGIQFSDENLENVIRVVIGKTGEEKIYKEDLRRIWSLDLSNEDIMSIGGLEYCKDLYNLYLDNNNITDISPLSNLKNLVELGLDGNKISDVSPLSNLRNLEFLYLSGNDVSDISVLSNLANLTELDLENNNIPDISPLFNLANLTVLYLGSNDLSDISVLSVLTNLRELDLSNNAIHNIFPLYSLTDLRGLNLQRNNIRDIAQIKGMIRIGDHEEHWIGAELDLSYNQISDITPLIKNPGVNEGDTVDISNNPLNSQSIKRYIPRLERRGVNLIWEFTKENSTPVRGSELSTGILAVVLFSILILYLYITRKKIKEELKEDIDYKEEEIEFLELKKLLEERNRLNTFLNELKSRREELISGRISEEKYKKMYDHVSERLETIENLIEEKRKKIVNPD